MTVQDFIAQFPNVVLDEESEVGKFSIQFLSRLTPEQSQFLAKEAEKKGENPFVLEFFLKEKDIDCPFKLKSFKDIGSYKLININGSTVPYYDDEYERTIYYVAIILSCL